MQSNVLLMGGLAGAGLLLWFDPTAAGRRRAFMRLADVALCDRVRRRIGHVVSSPQAIDIAAEAGRVVLTGAVTGAERRAVISAVARVPGVEYVDDFLDDPVDDAPRYGTEPVDTRWLTLPATPVVVAALTAGLAIFTAVRAIR